MTKRESIRFLFLCLIANMFLALDAPKVCFSLRYHYIKNAKTDSAPEIICTFAPDVRNMLTELIRNAQETDDTTTYQIEDLTDSTFVLKGGTILEPTGERLVYKRK